MCMWRYFVFIRRCFLSPLCLFLLMMPLLLLLLLLFLTSFFETGKRGHAWSVTRERRNWVRAQKEREEEEKIGERSHRKEKRTAETTTTTQKRWSNVASAWNWQRLFSRFSRGFQAWRSLKATTNESADRALHDVTKFTRNSTILHGTFVENSATTRSCGTVRCKDNLAFDNHHLEIAALVALDATSLKFVWCSTVNMATHAAQWCGVERKRERESKSWKQSRRNRWGGLEWCLWRFYNQSSDSMVTAAGEGKSK